MFCGGENTFSYCLLTVFCRRCCLVLGKWLIFPMFSSVDCPWRLMVGVNDLLYVAFGMPCITVNWKGYLVD